MQFEEFGSPQHPALVMMLKKPRTLSCDPRMKALSQRYHVVVPVFSPEETEPSLCLSLLEQKLSSLKNIFALCCVAEHWNTAEKLLTCTEIHPRKIFVEHKEIPPEQFLFSQLAVSQA
ncbi:MAG: hypothetical protein ACOX60_09800 [Massiliimalia sp.]|jgi:hypothetical protein